MVAHRVSAGNMRLPEPSPGGATDPNEKTMSVITPQSAHGLALARAAECMLRTLGGVEISVRFASPATPATAEFGLAASTTTDVPISPVIVRTTDATKGSNVGAPHNAPSIVRGSDQGAHNALSSWGSAIEFLFSASAVLRASQLDGYSSPIDWFAHSLGIVFNDMLYPIASVTTENFAGQPYLYRATTK